MTYNLQERLGHAGARFKTVNGEQVTYSDAVTSDCLTASPIHLPAEEIIPGVSVTRVEYQAWGVDVADLEEIFGRGRLPRVDDRITRAGGEEFRVLSMGGDQPPYQFIGSSRQRVLIHSQRTAV